MNKASNYERKMDQSKVRVAVSWFFIIATIVLTQISITRRGSDSTVDTTSIMQFQITGKYLTGMKQIIEQNPLLDNKRLPQLEQGVLNNERYINHLSAIPILAEISGREAALKELKRMVSDPGSVLDSKNIPVFYQLYNDGSSSLDPEQIAAVKSYGWAGRLALSQDKPDSDPERKAVLQSAFRMVMLAGLLTIMALAVIAGGVVLFIIAIVQLKKGKLKSHLELPENPNSLLIETFAIYLILSTVLPLLFTAIVPGYRYGSIFASIFAGLLPIIWPLLQGAGWKEYRTALGWHRGKGLFREIGAGIVGYMAGLPLMLAAILVVMFLIKYTGETPSHPVVFDLSSSPLFLLLLACVYAPFVEETLFRGALYSYLRKSLPWIVSAVITAFIFAILHPQGWIAVPAIGAIGFNLSAIREWRGSAIASMTAHALNNGSIVLILVISMA